MSPMNPKVNGILRKAKKWEGELAKLREIVLDCDLTEEVKWRLPCYTFQESNVVIIQIFKEYCALLFFKGALLKDAHAILVKPGENTQSGRQVRMSNIREIVELEPVLKAYIHEAIEVEKAGLKVTLKKEHVIPEELHDKFAQIPALKPAFEGLTPGRQKAYLLYFGAAKQSKTRASRIEKWMQQILDGKGLND
jgi:uncharacterized protein YdeI (YjbR/CyaY-like superfamily)